MAGNKLQHSHHGLGASTTTTALCIEANNAEGGEASTLLTWRHNMAWKVIEEERRGRRKERGWGVVGEKEAGGRKSLREYVGDCGGRGWEGGGSEKGEMKKIGEIERE